MLPIGRARNLSNPIGSSLPVRQRMRNGDCRPTHRVALDPSHPSFVRPNYGLIWILRDRFRLFIALTLHRTVSA